MFIEHKEAGEQQVKELDEPSKILLKAAAIIEERGWCQNKLETPDGRLCLVGALHNAAGGLGWAKGPKLDAYNRVQDSISVRFDEPASWNDEPGRTQAEVVAKLRAVAFGL